MRVLETSAPVRWKTTIPDAVPIILDRSRLIRVAEVLQEAIKANCPGIIVAHNHPPGDPIPSPEDVAVTEQIVAAGRLLGIEVLDHLVIGHQRYVSLKERRLGFG